ncbi:hypothetical protein CRG98_045962 [Punica granatum]|uniref:F-box domain-containing protein n=1 Tax=Punica granatum TaxID=22663 RepID=A0A2I0HPI0_PUNGR|nr:hypothetical protein CRG98_045962 [Punica granatum]
MGSSSLPDNVDHILGFVPNIDEAARMSVFSKSCLQAWRSFCPSLMFLQPQDGCLNYRTDPAKETDHNSEYAKQILESVDKCLSCPADPSGDDAGIQSLMFSLRRLTVPS